MLTLITGAPGTGKTAAVVDLLHTLGKDRPLFVHGLDGLLLPHFPLPDPTKWMDVVPDGACVIIDEVQNVWRPRGPGTRVPDHVAALETHRHRGLDFFLTTQGPNLVDSNVRALVGRHIHLRELGVLGRHWYEWPECADQCRTQFRAAPFKKRYKLPKHVFKDYKSASIHVKPIRSFPTALLVAVAALAATLYLAFGFYQKLNANIAGSKPSPKPVDSLVRSKVAGAMASGPAQIKLAGSPGVSPGVPTVPTVPAGSSVAVPVFAGCASARGHCVCYDTAGVLVPDPPGGSCERASGDSPVVLGLAADDGAPRPSHDLQADVSLIQSVTRRAPLPAVY
jgi:zona occludens toxin